MLPAGRASGPEAFADIVAGRVADFHLELSAPAREQLAAYLALLDAARRRTNLTGPLTAAQLGDHALESVVGSVLIPPASAVVDIGSGAGFPGLPLAIARPDIGMTLVEPRRKRLDFLREVVREVGLARVVCASRLQDLPRGEASVATARAVGELERVLGEAPFLAGTGAVLVWTTDAADLARRLGRRFSLERSVAVPGSRRKVVAAFRRDGEGSTWNHGTSERSPAR
jgi:16S rRNA (guanine527-N7)-methyltransferase